MNRAWRYHPEHEPKIFTGDEAIAAAEADGWQDSPAKCTGFLDKIGVDPNNALQVQYVAEVAEQTAEVVNLIENLDELDSKGLLRLAELHFSEDWKPRNMGAKKMRAAIKKRLPTTDVVATEAPADDNSSPVS